MQESQREREGRALASIASFFNTSSSFSLVVRSGPSARLTVLELAAVDELDEDRWAGGGGGWGVERAEEDDVRLKGGRDEADVWNESSDCEWTNAGAGETMIPCPVLRARRCTLRVRGGGVAGSSVEVTDSRASSSDYSDRVLLLSPISRLFSLCPVSCTQPTGTPDMLVLRKLPTRLVRSTRAYSVLAPPSSPEPQDLLSRYRSEVDSGRLQWQDDQARTIVQVNPLPLSLLPCRTFLTTSRAIDPDLFFVTRAASTRPPTSVVLHSQPSPPLHSSSPPPPSSTSTNPLLLAIQAHPSTV